MTAKAEQAPVTNDEIEAAIRELRKGLREERDHQFDMRLELHDRIGRRINDNDSAIGEMGLWLIALTVLAAAEAVAIGLLWWLR